MTGFRETKRCVNVNEHETHPWGETDEVFYTCPGLDIEEAKERILDLDQLASDYEELAERIRQRQLRSLKKHFQAAYNAGYEASPEWEDFEGWWEKFIEGSDTRWAESRKHDGRYNVDE